MVLGIPWEVDTDGLREYMAKFGELEDCIVMKERSTGRSRGFGYVTFSSVEDAKVDTNTFFDVYMFVFCAYFTPLFCMKLLSASMCSVMLFLP